MTSYFSVNVLIHSNSYLVFGVGSTHANRVAKKRFCMHAMLLVFFRCPLALPNLDDKKRLNYRLRPYHVEYTRSRPISEVKLRRAQLVLTWVTGWEY